MFVHSVYFWMKPDLTPDQQEIFDRSLQDLCTVETVKHVYVGSPAATDRPIIERSYTTALVVVFEDVAGHDYYQEHALHDSFRDNCGGFWSDIRIFDVVTP